jgi:Ca2+-binding EF-hand superfamily protein
VPFHNKDMSTSVPTKEECAELWSKFDYNGNGMLSLAELDKAVMDLWPVLNHKPAIMRAYKAADQQQQQASGGNVADGFIQKKEFRFFLTFVHYYNELWTRFSAADADTDRRLSRSEFAEAATALGVEEAEVDQVFDEIDTNRGGVVLFDEFCTWLAKRSANDE